MALSYQTGQEIQNGDRVLFHRNPATVELVASSPGDAETSWFVQEYGGGVMILDPIVSDRTFIAADEIAGCEDLEFVARPDSD